MSLTVGAKLIWFHKCRNSFMQTSTSRKTVSELYFQWLHKQMICNNNLDQSNVQNVKKNTTTHKLGHASNMNQPRIWNTQHTNDTCNFMITVSFLWIYPLSYICFRASFCGCDYFSVALYLNWRKWAPWVHCTASVDREW